MELLISLLTNLNMPVIKDVPDDPYIEAVRDGSPLFLVLGAAVVSAALLYMFYFRRKTLK